MNQSHAVSWPSEGALASARWRELAWIAGLGLVAALAATYGPRLAGWPGHRILYSALPLAMARVFSSRRGAGSLASGAAMTAAIPLASMGGHLGASGIASLALLGIFLDFAVDFPGRRETIYPRLLFAGMLSNLGAWLVGMIASRLGLAQPIAYATGRLVPSAVSFAFFGAVAGLMAALVWWSCRGRARADEP